MWRGCGYSEPRWFRWNPVPRHSGRVDQRGAFRDWVTNADNTYYCFGTAAGPHPFPLMVRDFQRVIGLEARAQTLKRRPAGYRTP